MLPKTELRAGLDTCYSRLWGLARDELRYILDPKDVYGDDFPDETVPRAEGEGAQAVQGIQDAAVGAGEVG